MPDFEITSEVWMKAKNLHDLGELTVQWLKGKLNSHFLQSAEPDLETSKIADHLIQINQLGLVTGFSQPAELLKNGSGQRACVAGFSDETIAKKLATLNLYTDLIVFVFEPGWLFSKKPYGYQVPITVEEYHPYTWCGSVSGDEMDEFEGLLGDEALISIAESWHIIAVDTNWGRKSYLWDNLVKTLSGSMDSTNKYSANPYPGHGLDVDFVY